MVAIKAEVEVEVEIWCGGCGADLCGQSTVHRDSITVEPCKKCLEDARQEGREIY